MQKNWNHDNMNSMENDNEKNQHHKDPNLNSNEDYNSYCDRYQHRNIRHHIDSNFMSLSSYL